MTPFYIFFATCFVLFLDPSWIDFWSILGPILAPKIDQKSIQEPFKIHPQLHHIFDWLFHRFWIHFGSILGAKMAPKSIQNRSNNRSNKPLIYSSMLNRFLIHFWTWSNMAEATILLKNQYNFKIFAFSLLSCCIDFLIHFWSILGATWPPKSIQNRSKIDPTINQKNDATWDRFWSQLGSVLERFWEPSWGQVGTKINPRSYQKINQMLHPLYFDFSSTLVPNMPPNLPIWLNFGSKLGPKRA